MPKEKHNLVIVESPAKAKTIEKYLEKGHKVIASVGHIRDLPKSNKKAIDMEKGFAPHYEVSKGKEAVVKQLKSEAKKAEEVILATDHDREGEAIAWHIKELCKLDSPKRIVFNEITKEAVTEAIQNPRAIDEDLRKAQEARRVLDRLVGYDLSGLIWKKLRYGLSAGRVQSPALRIVMEREREIRAFKKEKYWIITADTQTDKKEDLPLICKKQPDEEKVANDIVEKGKKASWFVKDIEEKGVKQNPKPPFITSTLQQAANSRLGFTPSQTMMFAQKLYEKGHITYMRTDSTNLAKGAQTEILAQIRKEFGKEYAEARFFATKKKSAQEAHEAIRPTNISKDSAGTTKEQKALYKLIRGRTLASQMTPAQLLRTKIIAETKEGDIPPFTQTGSQVVFAGFLAAYPFTQKDQQLLPSVKKDDTLSLIDISHEEKETQPPGRYTEAGLIKELEKRDIGRPSTYASIIRTIVDRGYVERQGRTLFPTDTGEVVNDFLEKNFPEYISDSFTSEMENELDEIAEGKRDYTKTLSDFYEPFRKRVESKENIEKITTLGKADKEHVCPKCKNSMVIKLGRGGKFLSCERFPDCDGARTIEGKELKEKEPLGEDPKTGLPVLVLEGRFGPYVQLGRLEKGSKKKPRRAGIPNDIDLEEISLEQALTLLSLPRELGEHPETGNMITANIGRFGPYIVHDGDFRSLKEDDPYTIELPRALEILKEEKKRRGRRAPKKK